MHQSFAHRRAIGVPGPQQLVPAAADHAEERLDVGSDVRLAVHGRLAAEAEFAVGRQELRELLRALAIDRGKQRTPPVSARHAS